MARKSDLDFEKDRVRQSAHDPVRRYPLMARIDLGKGSRSCLLVLDPHGRHFELQLPQMSNRGCNCFSSNGVIHLAAPVGDNFLATSKPAR